ncbi:unnamed protein product [Peniophora sp. CBMAI 1063]|nr:unnamed protein product [Peniophora sp. CBMAI 1063]
MPHEKMKWPFWHSPRARKPAPLAPSSRDTPPSPDIQVTDQVLPFVDDEQGTATESVSSTSSTDSLVPPRTVFSKRTVQDLKGLWDEALSKYHQSTGVDLTNSKSKLYRRLKDCNDHESIERALVKAATDFRRYRDPSAPDVDDRLRRILKPIVGAVLSVGALEAGGELASAFTLHGGKAPFVAVMVLFRATQGVSTRFDNVLTLLDRFRYYMLRLKVREDIPLGPELHSVIIEILVKMLGTFAIVTKTMQKNRFEHFMSVLAGGKNAAADAAREFDLLETQDTRLILSSVYKEVYAFNHTAQESLLADVKGMKDDIAQVRVNTGKILDRMEEWSTSSQGRFHLSTRRDLSANLRDILVVESGIASHAHSAPSSLVSTADKPLNVVSRETPSASTSLQTMGTAEIWNTCLMITYANMVSTVESFASNVLSGYGDFTPAERAALRNGLATIYSAAAFTASSGSENGPWFVALVNPSAFVAAFLPMTMTYLAAFVCWKNLPRHLGRTPSCTIVIIDIVGDHVLVPLDEYSLWEDIHALLLRRFTDKPGAEFVRSRDYRIMDTAGESAIIQPTAWTQIVKAGMTLEMGILLRQSSLQLQCPYCDLLASQTLYADEFLRCKRCKHQYRASIADIADIDDPFIRTLLTGIDPSTNALISQMVKLLLSEFTDIPNGTPAEATHDGDFAVQGAQSPRTRDMTLFRRILVEVLPDTHHTSHNTVSTGSSSLPDNRLRSDDVTGSISLSFDQGGVEDLRRIREAEALPHQDGRRTAVAPIPAPISCPSNGFVFSPAAPEAHIIADLWHEVFCRYRDIVGVGLKTHDADLQRHFEGCATYHDTVDALIGTVNSFELYRNPAPNGAAAKVRGALRDVMSVVSSIGVVNVAGEAAADTTVPGGKSIFVAIGVLLKVTKRVSDRFDAVTVLFEKFQRYMTRLQDLRLSGPIQHASHELAVKILVEMIGSLALATQLMHQNRVEHLASVLLG